MYGDVYCGVIYFRYVWKLGKCVIIGYVKVKYDVFVWDYKEDEEKIRMVIVVWGCWG